MSDKNYALTDAPQIPWAKNVKVTGSYVFKRSGVRDSVELALPMMKASVISNGQIHLTIDSKEDISLYLSKSPELKKSLYTYFKKADYRHGVSSFISEVTDWVLGEPFTPSKEPYYGARPGVLDWVPGMKTMPERIGKIGGYGSGKIKATFEHWIGTPFSYVHLTNPNGFFFPEDTGDGLVILWEGQTKPEVYVGDVESFLHANQEDFEDWERYRNWNETFENGLLWSLDYMGVFESTAQVAWAVDLIEHDPDLMWPELVEKLLPLRKRLPTALENSLMVWMERRRVEAEQATGQGFFWPREQP